MEEHYVEIQRIDLTGEEYEGTDGNYVLKTVTEKYYEVGFQLIGTFFNPLKPMQLNMIFIRKEK